MGVPSKVAFFLWTTSLESLPLLTPFVVKIVFDNWCCMYKCDGVNSQLRIHCLVASELWNFIYSLFGVEWVQQGYVMGVLGTWRGGRVGKQHKV